MRTFWFWWMGLVAGVLLVLSCTQGQAGPTIKTIFDLGVALCEVTLREDPLLIPPGQVGQAIDQICKDAAFAQPFVDEVLASKHHALLRMRPALKPIPMPQMQPDSVPPKD